MFGLNKSREATQNAVKYCIAMVGGLDVIYGKPLPNQAFGDAYVAGFFQQLILHAIAETWRGKVPGLNTTMGVAEATYDQIVPGFGRQIVAMFTPINQPTHPAHNAYKVGQREGQEYVAALLTKDQAAMAVRIRGFREFVVRNYFGAEYTG